MLSFRRWLDRVTDKRPAVRITRSSYRRRRPWRLLLLLFAIMLLIAALLIWSQSTPAPSRQVVEIAAAPSGGVLLAGAPASLAEPDDRLTVYRLEPEPVFAAIAPAPEALPARHRTSWMSAPTVGRAAIPGKGGDHGR